MKVNCVVCQWKAENGTRHRQHYFDRINSTFVCVVVCLWVFIHISHLVFFRLLCFLCLLHLIRCDLPRHHNQVVANGLQQHPSRSRSVPEGLASVHPGTDCHCNRNHWRSSNFRHPNRSVHVVEQITTSV